jgi:hypothetical protein
MPLFCKTCGERTRLYELREHLKVHNSNAEVLSWEEVRAQYEIRELEEGPTI